jgi:hypothetical protein
LPVVDNPRVPVAAIAPETLSAELLETKTLLPVDEAPPMLSAMPLLPVQLTLPVVLKVRLDVEPVKLVMLPEPERRLRFVAVTEPPV